MAETDRRFEYFIPDISMIGATITHKCELARDAGFDGIEVFLWQNELTSLSEWRAKASLAGLKLQFHEAWSYDESPKISNWVLHHLGALPQVSGEGLDWCQVIEEEPLVVYAHHMRDWRRLRGNFRFQTFSLLNSVTREFSMHISDFLDLALRLELPLVFDTQHYATWCFGADTVGDVRFRKFCVQETKEGESRLWDCISRGWEQLRLCVREIHLNNYQPSRGEIFGANIFPDPGKGILDLSRFGQMVHESGWWGTVVPEVSPVHMWRGGYNVKRFRKLRLLAERYMTGNQSLP